MLTRVCFVFSLISTVVCPAGQSADMAGCRNLPTGDAVWVNARRFGCQGKKAEFVICSQCVGSLELGLNLGNVLTRI